MSTETTLALRDHLTQVAARRAILALLKAKRDTALARWEARHAVLLASLKEASTELAEAEDAARVAAIAEYEASDRTTKKPGGVTIRSTRGVQYDPGEAAVWCHAHAMFLAIDWKGFERFAKDAQEPSLRQIVTVTETLAAALDGDLTAWLANGQEVTA